MAPLINPRLRFDTDSNALKELIEYGIEQAAATKQIVEFEHDGVTFNLAGDSDLFTIVSAYHGVTHGYIFGVVGPYPFYTQAVADEVIAHA